MITECFISTMLWDLLKKTLYFLIDCSKKGRCSDKGNEQKVIRRQEDEQEGKG